MKLEKSGLHMWHYKGLYLCHHQHIIIWTKWFQWWWWQWFDYSAKKFIHYNISLYVVYLLLLICFLEIPFHWIYCLFSFFECLKESLYNDEKVIRMGQKSMEYIQIKRMIFYNKLVHPLTKLFGICFYFP